MNTSSVYLLKETEEASWERMRYYLDKQVDKYNRIDFIENDPIAIPHQFTRLQDIEIAGFLAAILAWGNRKTILKNCRWLMEHMDNAPYDFVENFTRADFKSMEGFVHRTFNASDLYFTLCFFRNHYQKQASLEYAFSQFFHHESTTVCDLLTGFHHYFFQLSQALERTKKHIATPERKSACKRLNMFLRWMVRSDENGVDFGLWKKISQANLICPLDVHSGTTARKMGLLKRKQNDWLAAEELTARLKILDPEDPVKYDFALFGMGINDN